MSNDITIQTLVNGPRNLVLKINIDADGSGEEVATTLVDVSAYDATKVRIDKIQSALIGFSMSLLWDATSNKLFMTVPDYQFNQYYKNFGGLTNNAGAGVTGDVVFTTTGLTSASDHGHIVLEMTKTG